MLPFLRRWRQINVHILSSNNKLTFVFFLLSSVLPKFILIQGSLQPRVATTLREFINHLGLDVFAGCFSFSALRSVSDLRPRAQQPSEPLVCQMSQVQPSQLFWAQTFWIKNCISAILIRYHVLWTLMTHILEDSLWMRRVSISRWWFHGCRCRHHH